MKNNLPSLLSSYQLQTITISMTDDTLLPVSVIGSGEPVMLLHAFGMDARQFLPFILPLTQRYRFYLPHFRGFGMSSHLTLPRFDFIEQYVDDVEQVFRHVS
ncbi:MAG: alpha/beta fold hydrolase, partial [Psychrobacter sp.]